MSNNKQSSIEFIIESLMSRNLYTKELLEEFEQAKAMHKEEIVDACTECWMNDGGNGFHKVKEAESYYNETYNNENTDTTT